MSLRSARVGDAISSGFDGRAAYIAPVDPTHRTVTFVFTDIEGSTRLLRRIHDAYASLLSDHHAILDRCFTPHGGSRLSTEGDGGFFAFPSPIDAATATVAAQEEMEKHPWPNGERVRVRMGIHTGDATPTAGGGYVGLTVHLAARITALGHGGQVLISDAARRLIAEDPPGIGFLDLGLNSVADFPDPVRIHQVHGSDVASFPPFHSSPEQPLPSTMGRLVGRDHELSSLVDLVESHRLVTLLGPGGIGKTRLVIEAARRLRSHGSLVHFVDLTGVVSSERLPSAVLSAVGVTQEPSIAPTFQVASALGRRNAVLVLDNCEHLMPEVGRFVSELLTTDQGARVLATSRTPLTVPEERLFDLEPLSASDDEVNPAVELFVDRLGNAAPDFQLDAVTLPRVRSIVRRLDGLPLAIELAASMVRVLPLEELDSVLATRLDVLQGGAGRPDRHRSLTAALRWSVESLDDETRHAFASLGVMSGPFSVDDLLAVAGVGRTEAIQLATRLVDQSLLKRAVVNGRPLLRMLETIRWHALELLAEIGGVSSARDRHLSHFREVSVEARSGMRSHAAATTLARLWPRRPNLLSAFDRALVTGEFEAAVEIVEGLVDAWALRAAATEARINTTRLLEALTDAAPELRLRAAFARLEVWQSQGVGVAVERSLAALADDLARQVGNDGLRIRSRIWMMAAGAIPMEDPVALIGELERIGDPRALAYGMDTLGWMLWWEDRRSEAANIFQRLRRLSFEAGDPLGTLDGVAGVMATATTTAEFAEGARYADEVAQLVKDLGCEWWVGFQLQWEAARSRTQVHYEEAAQWLARAYRVAHDTGTVSQIAFVTAHQAIVALAAGDPATAYAKTREFAGAHSQASGDPFNPFALEIAAAVALEWGFDEEAAQLCGAAAEWRRPGGLHELGMPMPPWDIERHEAVVAGVRSSLEPDRFEIAWREGAAMPPEVALKLALGLRFP